MAGIFPESGAAGLAAIGWIFLESIELAVGNGFAGDGDQPDARADFFENAEWGTGIETREQKRQRKQCVEQSLKFKEEKKAQRKIGSPFLAQLHVAALFCVANDARKKQIESEAQAPESGHARDGPFSRGVTGARPVVPQSEQRQAEGPAKIDDRGIVDEQMNGPENEHHGGDDSDASEGEMNRSLHQDRVQGRHAALSAGAGCVPCRRKARRNSGMRIA